MPKNVPLQNKTMQCWLQNEGRKYLELLKEGKVECRDFDEELLKSLLELNGGNADDFPVSVKGELMYRELIPADLRILAPRELQKLLVRDAWYNLSTAEISRQTASKWKLFSADTLLRIIKHHPGIFLHWENWDWSCTENASKEAWLYLLKCHHSFFPYCPEKTRASFTSEDRYQLALCNPGLAVHLNLADLSSNLRDVLLRERPELAGCFPFEKADPPVKLYLTRFMDNCHPKEAKQAGEFLAKLLPDLPPAEAAEMAGNGEGTLGVFPRSRAELLKVQINSFLEENNINDYMLRVKRKELPLPLFAPADNLEYRIQAGFTSKIVEACMEEEKLSRTDILLTENFQRLRDEVQDLVLMKALSPELRRKAVAELIEDDGAFVTVEHWRAACTFGEKPIEHDKYEKLFLEAVYEGNFKAEAAMTQFLSFNFLSVEEALEISGTLPENLAQRFFDRCVPPLLRAYLLTKLSESEHTREKGKVINMLLQIFWHPERAYSSLFCDDDFELFEDKELSDTAEEL